VRVSPVLLGATINRPILQVKCDVAPDRTARNAVPIEATTGERGRSVAKPGTTLYFMCALHPWMQGHFLVK